MPKVKVNPDAKAPEFIAVAPGEYSMKFERWPKEDERCVQSEKGNYYTLMSLVHLSPATEMINVLTNQPLKATEFPGRVRAMFMMDPDMQGTLRQAIEATGQVWPTDANLEIDEEWIQQMLENKEVVVRLKTRQYQGNWSNEVARYVTAEAV